MECFLRPPDALEINFVDKCLLEDSSEQNDDILGT